MCIHNDTIHSVVSARLVDERGLIRQESEAPCRARCHQHVCANAHKALDTPVHTLRKSCAGCVCNMAAGDIPNRDVGSYRVREEAAGHNAADNLGSARQLLSFELAVDIAVARDNAVADDPYWPSVLHGSNRCGFWSSSLVGSLTSVDQSTSRNGCSGRCRCSWSSRGGLISAEAIAQSGSCLCATEGRCPVSPGRFLRDLGELADIRESFPAIDLFAMLRPLAFGCGSVEIVFLLCSYHRLFLCPAMKAFL